MKVREVQLSDIKAAKYNPRRDLKPGDPDYDALKMSVEEFGLVEPLIWNERTGNLVGGHQRLKILEKAGVKSTEVSVVYLDLEKEKALNLALNKISGQWDVLKLTEVLGEIRDESEDLLSQTGFRGDELGMLLASLETTDGEYKGTGVDGHKHHAPAAGKETREFLITCPGCGHKFERADG